MQPMQTQVNPNRAVAVMPPQAPLPQVSAEDINRVKRHTTYGAVKAVIGSQHLFETTERVKKMVPGVVGKNGKPKEIEVSVKKRELREVRALDQYGLDLEAQGALKWVSFDGEFEADTEAEIVAMIRAVYGSDAHMRQAGKTVLYCAASTVDCSVHVTQNRVDKDTHAVIAETTMRNERLLLSDRSHVVNENVEY